MNQIILSIAFLLQISISATLAQPQQTILRIGDKMPDINLELHVDDKMQNATFNQFKGKLVIIDFWNVTCVSCIKAMPKMDSIQREFDGKVQILMVTKDSKEKVDKLFSRITTKRPAIPMIYSDTSLRSIFPHEGQPYHVWISADGTVEQITHGYNADRKNIQKSLFGIKHQLAQASVKDLTVGQSLLEYVSGGKTAELRQSSLLVKGLSEYSAYGTRVIRDSMNGSVKTIRVINGSVLTLLSMAYHNQLFGTSKIDPYNQTRTILSVRDSLPFVPGKLGAQTDEWDAKYRYCYELNVSQSGMDNAFAIMQADLDNNFPYVVKIENRVRQCMVLRKIGSDELLRTKSTKPLDSFVGYRSDGSGYEIRNNTLDNFVWTLINANRLTSKLPIIDDTHCTFNVDLKLKGNLGHIDSLNQSLAKYGLVIVEEDRIIPMLVISDKI